MRNKFWNKVQNQNIKLRRVIREKEFSGKKKRNRKWSIYCLCFLLKMANDLNSFCHAILGLKFVGQDYVLVRPLDKGEFG